MRKLPLKVLLPLLLPLVLLAALVLAVNTNPGRQLVAWGIAEATGGQVVVSGLTGTLPTTPRVARLELRDDNGTWLVVEDAALDLDLWQLLNGELVIEALTAGSLDWGRLPARDSANNEPFRLPLRVRLRHLAIADLVLDRVVPGAPRLAIEGGADAAPAGEAQGTLLVTAPGRADRYRLEAGRAAGQYRLELAAQEAAGGLVAALAGRAGLTLPPDLGTWRLDAGAAGPFDTMTLQVRLDAGPLQVLADGVLDLESRSSPRLNVSADLPAMALTPDGSPPIAWERVGIRATLSGPLLAPQGQARVELEGLRYGDFGSDQLWATAQGDAASLIIAAEVQGLRAPVNLPATLTTIPLRIAAELTPQDPALAFRLSLSHPLIDLKAEGGLTARAGQVNLNLPDLAAFRGLTGLALEGSAHLDLQGAVDPSPRVDGTGELKLTQAPAPLDRLLGPVTKLAVSARADGPGWEIAKARIDGARIKATAQGQVSPDALALGWTLSLPDVGTLAPGWSGELQAQGGLTGRPRAPELVADLTAAGTHGSLGRGRVSGRIQAQLTEPGGSLALKGDWAGQPAVIELRAGRGADGVLNLALGDVQWAGTTAVGNLRLPAGATLPQGEVQLRIDRLADLTPLFILAGGTDSAAAGLAGRLTARLTLTDAGVAQLAAEGSGLALPGPVGIGTLALKAQVRDPLGAATTEASLRLGGLAVGLIAADLDLSAQGPLTALALTADAALRTSKGPASLAAAGRLDAPARRLTLHRLEAGTQGRTLSLLAPAVLDLADGLTVDRLRLGLGPNKGKGAFEVAGRLTPQLDLTGTLTEIPLDLVQLVAGDLPLAGILGARVRLTGPLTAPVGSVDVEVRDLRLTAGRGRAISPSRIKVSAILGASGTDLDGRIETGSHSNLRLRGRIDGRPPAMAGALALRADGRIDLALLDPLLTAGGRQVSGQAVLATAIAGTLGAPRLDGTLRLEAVTLRDRTIGLALTGVSGTLRLAGDTVRLDRLAGRAGTGTVTLSGSVGVLAPGLPVDLRLAADDARPVELDQLNVQGDADLSLRGRWDQGLTAAGTVRFSRIDIRLPERLPPSIAVLEVRERGGAGRANQSPPPPATPLPPVALDLLLTAPRAVYVRGRGIDAELGGEVRLGGTLADPAVSGGFDLRRGEYDLVGQTLRFTSGRIGFDGAAGLDPTLDLEARVTAADSTAILAVLGTASTPRIELRGEPELPQDEVLSRLLFGVAGGRLSPYQAARLGLAAASFAGLDLGQNGPGLIDRVRTGLGLDRLSLGSNAAGDTGLEGGSNLSERVYLGLGQSTWAGEPTGVLRIEVSPRIRVEADVGPIRGTRAGVAFEHEY